MAAPGPWGDGANEGEGSRDLKCRLILEDFEVECGFNKLEFGEFFWICFQNGMKHSFSVLRKDSIA